MTRWIPCMWEGEEWKFHLEVQVLCFGHRYSVKSGESTLTRLLRNTNRDIDCHIHFLSLGSIRTSLVSSSHFHRLESKIKNRTLIKIEKNFSLLLPQGTSTWDLKTPSDSIYDYNTTKGLRRAGEGVVTTPVSFMSQLKEGLLSNTKEKESRFVDRSGNDGRSYGRKWIVFPEDKDDWTSDALARAGSSYSSKTGSTRSLHCRRAPSFSPF